MVVWRTECLIALIYASSFSTVKLACSRMKSSTLAASISGSSYIVFTGRNFGLWSKFSTGRMRAMAWRRMFLCGTTSGYASGICLYSSSLCTLFGNSEFSRSSKLFLR